jgi:integrase
VRNVRLPDGRHTAATLLLSAGVHPRVVMEVLGHRRAVGQTTAGQGHSLYSGGLGRTVRPKVDALTPARHAYQATAAVTRPR